MYSSVLRLWGCVQGDGAHVFVCGSLDGSVVRFCSLVVLLCCRYEEALRKKVVCVGRMLVSLSGGHFSKQVEQERALNTALTAFIGISSGGIVRL